MDWGGVVILGWDGKGNKAFGLGWLGNIFIYRMDIYISKACMTAGGGGVSCVYGGMWV